MGELVGIVNMRRGECYSVEYEVVNGSYDFVCTYKSPFFCGSVLSCCSFNLK